MRPITQIIVHQTDTPTGTLESVERYHKNVLGFSACGYHYLIEHDGKVRKGRPNGEVGAHCQGDNVASLGICCVGTGDAFPLGRGYMNLAMLENLLRLIADLRRAYPTISELWGHRERESGRRQGKTCPGFNAALLRTIFQNQP